MPSTHSFALPIRMPFDWESFLAFLRLRATPGVETVTDSAYTRTISNGASPQTLSVSYDQASASLHVVYSKNTDSTNTDSRNAHSENARSSNTDSQDRYSGNAHSANPIVRSMVESRVKQIFKTDVSTGPIETFLGRDAWLAGLVARRPGLRVPGGWCAFEIAVRAVLGQQVSVPAATTLMGRLVRIAGSRLSETSWLFPTPGQVLQSSLSGLGVPGSRMETLKSLAAFFTENGESCLTQPDVQGRLLAVKGIGKWTAGYILMRTGDNQDHWPEGDLVLRKALTKKSKKKTLIAPARLEQAFRRWRPYRSYAAIHIWRGYVPLIVTRKP